MIKVLRLVCQQIQAIKENWTIRGAPTIMVASRPTKLMRSLESVFSAQGSAVGPLLVYTQQDNETLVLLRQLKVVVHVTKTPSLPLPASTISMHYRAMLRHVLALFPRQRFFIVLEDDVIVSPDFYNFLNVSAGLLLEDPSLYCVSAHNDISYPRTSHDPTAAIRTESYPNYGWMVRRPFMKELYRLLLEYPPEKNPYDWDMLAYKFLRQGRECIIPEISRSKHLAGGGVHVTNLLSAKFFDNKNYNEDPTVKILNIDKLKRDVYEASVEDLFHRAVFLDPTNMNPCMANFTRAIWDKKKVFALFFHLPRQEHFLNDKTYQLLSDCLGVFSLYSRESHHGLYRLRHGSSHLLLVGVPYSRYRIHRPAGLPLFYYSPKLKPEALHRTQ